MHDDYEVDRFECEGFTCRIMYDTDPAVDPRKDYDHAGTMLFTRDALRNYDVGDGTVTGAAGYYEDEPWTVECPRCHGEGTFDTSKRVGPFTITRDCSRCEGAGFLRVSPEKWALREHDAPIAVALRIGDGHGPLTHLETTTDRDYANGIAFLTRDTIREEWGKGPAAYAKARAYLTAEVEEYAAWIAGRVYGYIVEDENGETVDSCWGFIGEEEYAAEEAREAAKGAAEDRNRETCRAAYWASRDVETVA